jgi:hypothetical protein
VGRPTRAGQKRRGRPGCRANFASIYEGSCFCLRFTVLRAIALYVQNADVRTIPSNPARVATRVWKISILASLPLQNRTVLVDPAVYCSVYQFFQVFFVGSNFYSK